MTDPCHLLDVNVLFALGSPGHLHHRRAHQALDSMATWATCSITELGFFRLMLNAAVTPNRPSASLVAAQLRAMRGDPQHRWLVDDMSLAADQMPIDSLTGHQQVTDFHLVALARHHGAVLATFDSRLPGNLSPSVRDSVRVLR